MMNFIRSLCMTISAALLKAIPTLYALFHGLAAQPTIFNTAEIRELTNNIYTLVSVVMLFAFATKAISAIVNPDNLWDSKKGVTGVLKRSVIALVLIVAVPFGFQYFYEFQTQIINNNLIEKLILGIDYSQETLTDEEQAELDKLLSETDSESSKKLYQNVYKRKSAAYNIGLNLSQQILSSTLHPTKTDSSGDKCVSNGVGVSIINPVTHPIKTWLGLKPIDVSLGSNVCENYNNAISGDSIDYVDYLVPQINSIVGVETPVPGQNASYYVLDFDYWGLLCVIASGAVVYLLIIFCIDSAVRLIKMAFLEITAPVSIMAYIFGGNDVLKKWFRELYTTAISFFLRVAAISFIALVLVNLNTFVDQIPSYYSNMAKIFIIVGTLIFAKKVPELIERVIGVKLNLQGGLGGRLSQMAGVGKVAQNAWKSLGNTARGIGATTLGLGLGAIGAGAKAGINRLDNRFGNGEFLDRLKSNRAIQGITAAGQVAHAGISQHGNIGKTVKAMQGALDKTEMGKSMAEQRKQAKAQAQRDAERRSFASRGFDENGNTKKNEGITGKEKELETINNDRRLTDNEKQLLTTRLSKYDEVRKILNDVNNNGQKKVVEKVDDLRKIALNNGDAALANRYQQILDNVNKGKFADALLNVNDLANNGKMDAKYANDLIDGIKAKEQGLIRLEDLVNSDPNELGKIAQLSSLFNVNADGSFNVGGASINGALDQIVGNSDKNIKGVLETINSEIDNVKKAHGEDSYISNIISGYQDDLSRHNQQIVKDYKDKNYGVNEERYKHVDSSQNTNANPNNNNNNNNPNNNNNQNINNNNGTPNINGGTIHVDNIQAGNINASSINGQNINANNIPDGFTRTDSGIVIPNSDSRQNTDTTSTSSNNDQTVLADERLTRAMERIEQRIRDIQAKGAFMTSEDRDEINELRRELSEKAGQQWRNNGGPSDDVQ
ncbi:MAG: hypothetical protein IJ105_03220 [Bacilli bacterium]|nr:hypothetical protein [Bacilli bacterium]